MDNIENEHLNTFGNFECSRILIGILEKGDPKTRHKAYGMLDALLKELSNIDYIPDSATRFIFLARTRIYFLNRVATYKHFSDEVKDFMTGTMVTICRTRGRKYSKQKKHLRRNQDG